MQVSGMLCSNDQSAPCLQVMASDEDAYMTTGWLPAG